jgi:hypothetical protein
MKNIFDISIVVTVMKKLRILNPENLSFSGERQEKVNR